MQEDHDLANDLLVGPACRDSGCTLRADAVDLTQPLGSSFDDIEDILPEDLYQPLGIDRPYTAQLALSCIFGLLRERMVNKTLVDGLH